jgi:hypothetical protein
MNIYWAVPLNKLVPWRLSITSPMGLPFPNSQLKHSFDISIKNTNSNQSYTYRYGQHAHMAGLKYVETRLLCLRCPIHYCCTIGTIFIANMVPSNFALRSKNYYAVPEFSIILSGLNYYECFVNKITTGHVVRYRYLVSQCCGSASNKCGCGCGSRKKSQSGSGCGFMLLLNYG